MKLLLNFSIILLLFTSCGIGTEQIIGMEDRKLTIYDTISTACGQYLFSINAFESLSKEKDTNCVFSPFGTAALFTMLQEGSSGKTQEELQKVMCINSNIMSMHIKEVCGNYDPLADDSKPAAMKMTNTLFVNDKCHLHQKYSELLKSKYNADAKRLNSSSVSIEDTIGNWADRLTGGYRGRQCATACLSNSINAVNTVTFKGAWLSKFDKKLTKRKCFHQYDGKETTVDMMSREDNFFYMHNDTMQVVAIPYTTVGKGVDGIRNCSMWVLLPREGHTIKDVMAILHRRLFGDIIQEFEYERVNLRLPRFTINTQFDAKKLMASLGARHMNMFDGIMQEPLNLSNVSMSAEITVDEDGTLAKNAENNSPIEPCDQTYRRVYNFNANRPFIYMIVNEDTNTILFMGQYINGVVKENGEWQSITYSGIKEKPESISYLIEGSTYHRTGWHEQNVDKNKIYDVAENMPSFPGGQKNLMEFLNENTHYPEEAKAKGIQGRVIVQFHVMRDGSIEEIKIAHSVDPLLDKEAIRVIKAMPRWQPGMINGEKVNVRYTLPLTFRL